MNPDLDFTHHKVSRQRGFENGTVVATGKRTKKWMGFYHVYVPDGAGRDKRIKRRRIIADVVKMTKAQAEDEHREFIRRMHQLPVADAGRATVGQLADDLYALSKGEWGERERIAKRSMIDSIIKPEIGKLAIEDVTAERLKRFMNELPGRQWRAVRIRTVNGKKERVEVGPVKTGISTSYAEKIRCLVRKMFRLAMERELIRKNPADSVTMPMSLPKLATKPDKSVFPVEDLAPLLQTMDRRDKLVTWISVLGATRPSELFGVKGADVGPGWVRIKRALDRKLREKETKTGRERTIMLPEILAGELASWIKDKKIGPRNYVFPNSKGGAMNRGNFLDRHLRGAAKRAGIETQDVDFQMLRRSFATLAGALGIDIKSIQAQLGHTTPNMTVMEYMQPMDGARRESIRRMELILRGEVQMPEEIRAKLASTTVQ